MTNETTGPDDAELVARARDGDDGAYAELWRRHHDAGRRAVRAITRTFDADDVVQEAFTRVLSAVRRGGGPDGAFRPYLYAAVRNVVADWGRARGDVQLVEPTDDADPDAAFDDAVLERTLVGAAFRSLRPEWQAVLWYTEVERMKPSEAAPLLGMSANATAALAYRARDALRTAWLQAHVNDLAAEDGCRWTAERLGAYSRRTLARRERDRVEEHLTTCLKCPVVVAELEGVAGSLQAALLPLVLGTGGVSMAGATSAVTGNGSVVARGPGDAARRVQRWVRRSPVTVASAAATIVVAGAVVGAGGLLAAPDAAPPHVQAPSSARAPASPSDSVPARGPSDTTVVVEGAHGAGPRAEGPTGDRSDGPDGSQTAGGVWRTAVPISPTSVAAPGGASDVGATVPGTPAAPPTHDDGGHLPEIDSGEPAGPAEETPGDEVPGVAPGTDDPGTDNPGTDNPGTDNPGTDDPGTDDPGLAAPVVTGLDTLDGLALPVVDGTGLPGAEVRVLDGTGTVVGRTTVDEAGRWSVLAEVGTPSVTLTVVQEAAGVVSAPATAAPVRLATPEVVALVDGVRDPLVTFTGPAGRYVQALVDGVPTATLHQLGEQPLERVIQGQAPGNHTLGLRFYDPATGRHGLTVTRGFVVTGRSG
jgi:RNA polymerase sigma factor (sigma-70 family)